MEKIYTENRAEEIRALNAKYVSKKGRATRAVRTAVEVGQERKVLAAQVGEVWDDEH